MRLVVKRILLVTRARVVLKRIIFRGMLFTVRATSLSTDFEVDAE
jgi:hypothetical protein